MLLKTSLSALVVFSFLFGASPVATQDNAKETLMQIYKNDMKDYQKWSVVPGTKKMMPGKGAHGKFITTYTNEIAQKAIDADADAMPDGALLVKDNFHTADDAKPWSAVIMKKIDGKWFFGVFAPLYEAKMAGFPEAGTPAEKACMSCHAKAPNDKVFLWQK